MNDDHDVTDLMNRAVATLEPRTSALVAGGAARGRTRLRRRRAAQFASGLALTGLIAGVAVAVWPSSASTAPGGDVPAAGRSAEQQSSAQLRHERAAEQRRQQAIAARKRERLAQRQASSTAVITPQVIAQRTIDALLSGGHVSRLAGTYDSTFAGTTLVYDDGRGAAQIGVSLDFTGAQSSAACQISVCTKQPDGSTIAVYQGSDHPGQPNAEPKQWTVSLMRRDGVLVTFSEWNAPEEKGAAPITRAEPPFSIKTARQFVLEDSWQTKVAQSEVDADAGLFTPDNIDG